MKKQEDTPKMAYERPSIESLGNTEYEMRGQSRCAGPCWCKC